MTELTRSAKATLLFQRGEYKDAMSEYSEMLSEEPNSGHFYSMIAWCLFRQDKLSEAETSVNAGLNKDANYAGLYYVGCCIKQKMNDPAAAKTFLLQALKLKPDDVDYLGVLSTIQLDNKEWVNGRDTAIKGLNLMPGHEVCASQYERAMHKLGQDNRKVLRWSIPNTLSIFRRLLGFCSR